jgi:hypothetical protein
VVLSEGCYPEDTTCKTKRGGVFQKNQSSTWQEKGLFELFFEQNLGINDNGDFGLDSFSLGLAGTEAAKVFASNQLVAGIAAQDIYIATWGIRPAETNLYDSWWWLSFIAFQSKAAGSNTNFILGLYSWSLLEKHRE